MSNFHGTEIEIWAGFGQYRKKWKFLINIQMKNSDPKRTGVGKCLPSCQLGIGDDKTSRQDNYGLMMLPATARSLKT